MGKQAIREGKFVYYFDNLPDGIKLRVQDSKKTLSLVPNNFTIINNSETTHLVIEEEENKTSLTM